MIDIKISSKDNINELMSSRLEMLKVVNDLPEDYEYSEEIINESFKSTLLQNLAREIKRVEEPVRKADKINAAKYSNYHYKNRAKSFQNLEKFGRI